MDLISKYNKAVNDKRPVLRKFTPLSDIHAGSFITQSAIEEARIRIMEQMLATWGNQIDNESDRFQITGTRMEGDQMIVNASYRPLQSVDYITVRTSLVEADRPDRNGNVYSSEALQRGIEMHERFGRAVMNPNAVASLRGLSASASFLDEYSFVPTLEMSPKDVAKAVMSND